MLFSALFRPRPILSKIRFRKVWRKESQNAAREFAIRIGPHLATGRLAPTAHAGRFAADLPLAGKGRKIGGLFVIHKALPLADAQANATVADPGQVVYSIERQAILINTRRVTHPFRAGERFVSLGQLQGAWRAVFARIPIRSRVLFEPWP